jgi:hypothetical protein
MLLMPLFSTILCIDASSFLPNLSTGVLTCFSAIPGHHYPPSSAVTTEVRKKGLSALGSGSRQLGGAVPTRQSSARSTAPRAAAPQAPQRRSASPGGSAAGMAALLTTLLGTPGARLKFAALALFVYSAYTSYSLRTVQRPSFNGAAYFEDTATGAAPRCCCEGGGTGARSV